MRKADYATLADIIKRMRRDAREAHLHANPNDLSHAWIGEVEFDAARDIQLIVAIVRASENQKDTLED